MGGFIYVMSNPSFLKGRFKIGKSDRDPEEYRRNELDTTGVPEPFVVEYFAFVDDHHSVERSIHRALSDKRPNSQREFFDTSINEVIAIIESVTTIVFERPPRPRTRPISQDEVKSSQEQSSSDATINISKSIGASNVEPNGELYPTAESEDPGVCLLFLAHEIAQREQAELDHHLDKLGVKLRDAAEQLLLTEEQIAEKLNNTGRYNSEILEEEFSVVSLSAQPWANPQEAVSEVDDESNSLSGAEQARMQQCNKLAIQIIEEEFGPVSKQFGTLSDKIVKHEMLDIKEGGVVDKIRIQLYRVGSYYSETLKRVFLLPPEYLDKPTSDRLAFRAEQSKREEMLARLHLEGLEKKKSLDELERKNACYEFARSIYQQEKDRAAYSNVSTPYGLSEERCVADITEKLLSVGGYYSRIFKRNYRVEKRLLPRFRGDSSYEIITS
jgi:hypothetical protein